LIEKSLGDPAGFCVTEKKSALIAAARSMGLRAPRTECIANRHALSQVATRATYPSVLKRDQTWSGIGVAFVQSEAGLPMAWSWIAGWISILRAVKAVRRDRRPRTLLDVLANRGAAVELQEFVAGTPANRAVLCRDGRVVAGLSVLALQTAYEGGPASVVRVVDHPEMTQATEALVRHLGLSGFCGFDFVISPSGQAYLLELNPRATPVSHLALANGTHLPAEPAGVVPTVPHDLIALFPTEWQRDRSGASLHNVHHDAPWDEPALLAYAGLAGNEDATTVDSLRRKLHSLLNA
jgi:glutathione synthase/RimK-type ligase-like ATP-grasp enzyme